MIVLCFVSLVAVSGFVYANTKQTEEFTIKTVHVFPERVETDGWSNVETLGFRNLDEDALYQDFNKINSAYIDSDVHRNRVRTQGTTDITEKPKIEIVEAITTPLVDVSTSTASSSIEDFDAPSLEVSTATATATEPENISLLKTTSTIEDGSGTTTESLGAEIINKEISTSEDVEATSSPINEVSETEVNVTNTTTPEATLPPDNVSGFKRLGGVVEYAFASIQRILPFLTSTEEIVEGERIEESSPSTTVFEIVSSDSVSQVDATTTVQTEALKDFSSSSTEATNTEDVSNTILATSTEGFVSATNSTPSVLENPFKEEVELESTTTCETGCAPYSITLTDFGLPLFEGKERIGGGQIRLSFAAQKMSVLDTREQSFVVSYSLDGGETWLGEMELMTNDEVSNSLNGGYHLIALPDITEASELDGLVLKLQYFGDPRGLSGIYLDSVWLELFTIEGPDFLNTSLDSLINDDGYDSEVPEGDTLTLPNGEQINFDFTDENEDETLIIKSDNVLYSGLSETTLYFNVTNTSKDTDTFTLQTYFPKKEGQVSSISEWNQNVPRRRVVPEYRPFVYHCEAGWEVTENPTTVPLEDISKLLSPTSPADTTDENLTENDTSLNSPQKVASSTREGGDSEQKTTEDTGTSTLQETEESEQFETATSSLPLTQAVLEESFASTSYDEVTASSTYMCRDTNVVRECDAITGDNTQCRVENVKVHEHEAVQYERGWETKFVNEGSRPDTRKFVRKVLDFIGFGPEEKTVPDTFEPRAYSNDQYQIAPGETKYFKMDIAFPAFSSGEFWIEAIGETEYGLLDPFWSSQWQYRMPIYIDNTESSNALSEYQVFLELDSSLTDFWSGVNTDGSDIRFVQETTVGNTEDWYGTGWERRTPITIQATQVDENMTDFPVYVDLSDLGTSFFNNVQADGDDIRITESDGLTELPYELVSINTGGETGELHFKANSISSTTDTTFYIYHDNPNVGGYAATDTYGAENVWGSDFIAVYHLEEDAAGRSNTALYQDSTNNGYDADDELNSTGKTGQLGQGQEVNAQGDGSEYILLPSNVVNSETQLTFSYWMLSSETNDQALISGGSGNEYLLFLQSGGSTMNLFPGSSFTIDDLSVSPVWKHIMVSRDTSANEWRVFIDGVEDDNSPSSQSLSTLSIPSNCLVIGLEQDTTCLSSGDTSQHLNAFIDEMRFHNTVPTDGEISAVFRNQATTTDFYSIGTPENLTFTVFTELDHWVQYFNATTSEADVWVQVEDIGASGSTTIHLYYGNQSAQSTSDEEATFTYSTTTDLYYVVDGNSTGNIEVYSLIDGNEVSIDGGTAIPLDEGETTSFATYSSSSVISTLGPISATIDDAQADSISPIAFASTTHAAPTNRGTSEYFIHAPFASTTVRTYVGNSGTPDEVITVATGTTEVSNTDAGGNNAVIIEATSPVLVYHQEGTRDSFVAYPPTTRDLFGIDSNNTQVTTLADNPDPDVYCSSGESGSAIGITRGEEQGENSCTDADQGVGPAMRFTNAVNPIAVIQQADSDGGESTSFWPQHEFGTQFYMTTDSAYAAIACSPRFGTSTVEVQTNGGTTVESATCAPDGEFPGKAYFDNSQGGSALAFSAGHQIVSTNGVPFYVIYEDDEEDNDETNILGSVQARKFDGSDKRYSFGGEEIMIDAEYEQLAFSWFENANSQTPTSTWPLGEGSQVTENQAITGQGGVSDGDVLRLRMSLQANVATGTASSSAFALEYVEADTCSTASEWHLVGEVGSSTAAFSGYDNSSLDDGSTLSSTTLAASTVYATYEESNYTEFIPNEVPPDEVVEWDWVITSSNANTNSNYCFRMVRANRDELITYTLYPELETSGPPSVPTLSSFFDNERTATMTPVLEFNTTDLSGDDIHYQMQISSSSDFGTTIIDRNSETHFSLFENINTPSDKAPFDSGAVVRFTSPSSLAPTSTYWWRTRARDPEGSNTWSDWSSPFSFTTWSTTTLSEWYQTTDEQFETNSLVSATTTGSGSVELDLGGASTIGEYGSVTVTNGATTTITYYESYTTPVVVASVRYDRSVPNGDQVAARVFNKTGTGFDVLSDNFTYDAPGTSTVDYMVMEAGEYLMDDGGSGVRVFASTTPVSAYDGSPVGGDPGGPSITFPTTFSGNPTVLTMVTTKNDPDWVVSTPYDGADVDNPPSASDMSLFLNDNLATDGHTSAEDIDFIAFDQSDGTNNGVAFDIANTGISSGVYVSDAPYSYPFNPAFSSEPGVILVSMLTSNGGDGGYAMVDDNTATPGGVAVAVEEGGTTGARSHTEEDVGIVSFESASGTIARAGTGLVTSSAIDFDDAQTGNSWGEVLFSSTGDITYHIEYNTGSGFSDIPDSSLSGNSTGFTTSPINILDLDTETYNEIRLVAELAGAGPELYDWNVVWGQRIEIPTLLDPFDNEKIPTTTPTFEFTTTDPEGDGLVYEISWSTDNTFVTGSTTRISSTSLNFANQSSTTDSSPFISGDTITYTVQSGEALVDGETYWWRVRAIDPAGSNSFSPWSDAYSLTVDTTVSVSTWFQTTAEQFRTGTLSGVSASTTGDFVTNDTTIGEFGTMILDNGSSTVITTLRSYNDPVVVASVEYSIFAETQRVARVLSKSSDQFTILVDNYDGTLSGTTSVDYVIMEAGDWTIEDGLGGVRVVADTYENVSTVRANDVGNGLSGQEVTFSPNFSSAPSVMTTVSSNNDSGWVFSSIHAKTDVTLPPTVDGFLLWLNRNFESASHGAENVDYIAFETGHGTNNLNEFDFVVSGDLVDEIPETVSFNSSFSSIPQVTLVQQVTQDGGNGGFAATHATITPTVNDHTVFVDEDGSGADRLHGNEYTAHAAFEGSSGLIYREDTDTDGTAASPAIPFSDGSGPKFERYFFYATSTGNSTTTLQVQYQTATGSWALIPDSQIPGNSTGTTTSPVDLTNVDVSTFDTIRLFASLLCDGIDCPTLNDWTVEWSEGVPVSGTIKEYDRITNVTSGTVRVAVNNVLGNSGTIAGDGTWSINNVTAFNGDVITVWVDGAAEADEAVGVFVYDGIGDMTGIELFEQHLSISSDENGTTTNALLATFDNSVSGDEDIFFDVDASNDLTVCASGNCGAANLYIGPADIYIPDYTDSGDVATHDFVNDGILDLDGNTFRISGSYEDNATTTLDSSTVIFTATSSSETVDTLYGDLDFNNLTFGETLGTATWQTYDSVDLSGNLTIDYGTYNRSSSSITLEGDLSIGGSGLVSGSGTTTFDGSSAAQWTDATASGEDVGNVNIDGSAKTVTLQSDVLASSVTIGANDTLSAGGSNTLNLLGNFTNNNSFSAQTGTIAVIGTSTNAIITTGGSSLYNLTASTTDSGSVSFTETNLTLLGDLAIATGTVTLPTATTSINGSFTNSGGVFAHNNGEVRFTSSGSETIELNGTEFLNHFYTLSFTGSGAWTFVDTNATTSNTLRISDGTVTFPTETLSVARDFTTTGSGAFNHNGGEVILLIEGSDSITTNGSNLNDVRVRAGGGTFALWYDENWTYRIPLTVRSSEIDDDLTDFPVFVDLADLPSALFANLNIDGGDIRITESDGQTEVPREVVAASTTAETGELHFRATNVSSTTDTIFYLYYGNSGASDYGDADTYGAEAVWSSSFVLAEHLTDLTTATVLNSADSAFNGSKQSVNNPAETASGQMYEGQSFDGSTDWISHGDIASGEGSYSFSGWFNTNDLTGAGDTATYGYSLWGISPASSPYNWLTVGGTGFTAEARICAYENTATACTGTSGANLTTGVWYYISVDAVDGGATEVRIDGNQVLSYTNDGDGTLGANFTIGDLRPNRNIDFDGLLDEFRFATTTRGAAWHDATYRNQSTSSDFYAVGAPQQDSARTFADTNAEAEGDVVIESGVAVFPTGVFSIGGSFDNNDEFDSNSGTVRFNATSGVATIAVGTSTFYNLDFNSTGGDWTIVEHATATNAITFTDANTLTVNSGVVLESTGTFSNSLDNASTTWTGATLRLSSGNDFALNTKDSDGDNYNILTLTGDTDVSMWNSRATTSDTQASSSIYSQDHDGIDGDLYIFGDYVRAAGTEYWTFDTDFDGEDLTATSSERQVNVLVADGSWVTASSATLLISGSSTASTTVDAQSGSFGLLSNTATVTASYFTMTGTNATGFRLFSSSTLTLFDNAEFTIPGTSAAITVDASTVDTNPASQFFDTNFVTGGGNVNVDLSGTPTSYWWFRDGTGDRYGEAFDNDAADPGPIRWDDSNYQINISGVVYADDGTSPLGGPTCDGGTNALTIVVDGGAYTDTIPCNGVDGTYSFSNVSYNGDATIVVYLDNAVGGDLGSVITRTPTTDITDLDVYVDRVMTRHEDVTPLTIEQLAIYDENDDSDLRFSASTGTTDTLIVRPDTELYVWASSTFTPGGVVTLQSGGTGNVYDGSLHLGASSTFTGVGTTTYSVGGSLILDQSANLITASSTFTLTATTTGKAITASSTITFNELTFTGVGGNWNINTDIIVAADIEVATGTVTGTGDITLSAGDFFGDGLVSLGGGTVLIETSNTLGGVQGWTFNNLTLGNGSVVGTTTPGSSATTTVAGVLTINTAHFLDAGSSAWNLTGTGSVFAETGTFLEDTSTVRYGGTGGSTILNTDYYNLIIDGDGSSPTFTAANTGIQVQNDLNVGTTGTTTFTITTNDPVVSVSGDVYVGSLGTLIGSNSATLSVAGSWDNDGVFTASGGLVLFTSADAFTIAAGDSDFSDVSITAAGSATITEHATSSGSWTFATTSDVTVASGQRLAVGDDFNNNAAGAATTWTGSTLYLFGAGQFEINATSTQDEYGTVSAATGTHVRMWNSSSSVYDTASGGSIYSMNHENTSGELYIFGDYEQDSGSDYWSYGTDFDGSTLGSGRQVSVYVENGGSVILSGGSLEILGTTTASTTIQNQGSGTYSMDITGGTFSAEQYILSDLDSDGLTFSGTPTVTTLSYGKFNIGPDNARGMTIAGSVIDQNPAKNFVNNVFATTTGVSIAYNASTTGTTVSSWRFTTHSGDVDGESFDLDGGGDPGYLVWDDSLAVITISGRVYENDEASVSSVCGGSATNIVLAVDGVVTPAASSSCDGTGLYSISGISFSPNDTLTLFIDGELDQGATVSIDPISSVGNMDIYEDHVIVRHEGSDPILIADLADFDSVDDSDVPFTAVNAVTDTLTLDPDFKLIVWDNKEFEPQGNITTGGGSGGALDGTVELQDDSTLTLANSEAHSFGGNLEAGIGAVFTPSQSTVTFTSGGTGRTIDTNESGFYNIILNSSGTYISSDTEFGIANDLTLTSGTITLPNGTTSISGSLTTTGGAFNANGGTVVFDSSAPETITAAGSEFNELTFTGSGSWSMDDTNATATGPVSIESGTVTLPSGVFAVGGSFRNVGGSITHNTSELSMSTSSSATLLTSGSDLYAVRMSGGGEFVIEDTDLTFLDDFVIINATATLATGTLSIGGSFDASNGSFANATGTVLFNSSDTGETVDAGGSSFYNINFGSGSGGWTLVSHASATNNFTLSSANSFTVSSGQVVYVGNVFTNSVGGLNTTWAGSTLILDGGVDYTINSKSAGGDEYESLVITADTDIRMWDSQATTTTIASSSSLYSQDHAGASGDLYIYGDFHVATGTEYWNYSNDFDGTAIGGRIVNVYIADTATATIDGGVLNIVGDASGTTTVQNQGSGSYAFLVNAGTFNASYYAFRDFNAEGLRFEGTPTVSSLSNGDFVLAVNGGSLITLSSTTQAANASLQIYDTRFATTTAISGFNVNLNATTSSAWTFRDHTGNLSGENFDVDGTDDCGSVRWDDSSCLLVEQTHYRWRNDDGGLGAPDSEWFNISWGKRARVRVVNNDNASYSTTSVKVAVTYDADMQSDFEDLRFTAQDGVTEIPYWIEKYTASTDATVWIQIPELSASGAYDTYMYYDNVTATTTSSSTEVFIAADDFEDNDISEYSGDTAKFQTAAASAFGGSYGVEPVTDTDFTADGITRFDQASTSQGQIIRYMQYVDTTGTSDEACALFGVQSPITNNENYAVCLELFGTDRMSLVRDAERNDNFGTVVPLASTTVSFSTGWYEVEIDWQTDDTIDVTLYNDSGSVVATTSATDANYTSGGYGFTYWEQKGGWDSFTARYRTETNPSVVVGVEQQDGGASWSEAIDTVADTFEIGDVARLRIAVENSGLAITSQEFQIESAPKGVAPTCESVSSGSFSVVLPQTTCGSSALCMATTTNYTDGDPTSDLLIGTRGTFTAGEAVEDPSSTSSPLDIDQDEYTELEFALTPTVNATDSNYCFRVTNGGDEFDAYSEVAEIQLQFNPSISALSLNGGLDISLIQGTTTTVYATGTVTDLNGVSDLDVATATIFRSGVGASCSSDTNNCYISTAPQCVFQNCAGNTCDVNCSAEIIYHADPTDIGTYAGETWRAQLSVSDNSGAIATATAPSVDLLTLRALSVSSTIDYGTLTVNSDTGAYNATTSVENIGNDAIDLDIEGSDLTDGGSSLIGADEQIFATSTFSYSSCVFCSTLATTTTNLEVDLGKPTTTVPGTVDEVYWGINIPFGVAGTAHQGINTFYAVSD